MVNHFRWRSTCQASLNRKIERILSLTLCDYLYHCFGQMTKKECRQGIFHHFVLFIKTRSFKVYATHWVLNIISKIKRIGIISRFFLYSGFVKSNYVTPLGVPILVFFSNRAPLRTEKDLYSWPDFVIHW